MTEMAATLDRPTPPPDLAPAEQALWWLAKGNFAVGPEWERAHAICAGAEGVRALDWIHALAHRIEGDEANASYWYRRAGETRRRADPHEEWSDIVRSIRAG